MRPDATAARPRTRRGRRLRGRRGLSRGDRNRARIPSQGFQTFVRKNLPDVPFPPLSAARIFGNHATPSYGVSWPGVRLVFAHRRAPPDRCEKKYSGSTTVRVTPLGRTMECDERGSEEAHAHSVTIPKTYLPVNTHQSTWFIKKAVKRKSRST